MRAQTICQEAEVRLAQSNPVEWNLERVRNVRMEKRYMKCSHLHRVVSVSENDFCGWVEQPNRLNDTAWYAAVDDEGERVQFWVGIDGH